MYVDVLKEFKSKHPDFIGSRFMYGPMRSVDDEVFNSYLPIMLKLQNNFPEFIAGFDLVGQEDTGKHVSLKALFPFKLLSTWRSFLKNKTFSIIGRPLIDFAERLLKFPEEIQFYFHAGETNWLGTSSDENLVG